MSKIGAIKLLLSKPLTVIKSGIIAQHEKRHDAQNSTQHGIRRLPTIDILDLIPNMEEEIVNYSFLPGTSLITDIILLKSLAKKFENCEYLEIGSFRGESLFNVASVAKHCTSLTLSKEEMKAMNFNEGNIKAHGLFSKEIKNLTSFYQNSHTFDFSKFEKKFDLIFIDGDHTYEGVKNDTSKTFDLRKDENSIIVWHDYSFNTENVRASVLHGILDGIPKDKHKNLYHISNTMCAVYMENVNYSTKLLKDNVQPDKTFNINLSAKRI
ncbi:class I SAM-dependent methyltransferase [Paracrocinitomix mangrovi]|uniref:class I SAM-dependent methyltransferase n=1 Tax=Paracrocinitomix mangrovi TaxID=2862509 RepID=UPI001C8DA20F|nr:class I SAM-dependent methyltransferase [Paracrocinitomix mangrovi]UKN01236.1 class I SAM-dependent methyltransferase [Paracrocinitomix mangrovi]